jgi:hypothetical protein
MHEPGFANAGGAIDEDGLGSLEMGTLKRVGEIRPPGGPYEPSRTELVANVVGTDAHAV